MLDNKLNTAARLKEARIKLRVGSGEFAQKAGIDPRNYSSIETGKRTVGERILRDICSAFPIDINWLLTGDGEMLKGDEVKTATATINYDGKGAPYYDVDFIGGFDLVGNDQTTIPTYYINYKPYNKATCWVNVTGHSMDPSICSGDVVALKQMSGWRDFLLLGEIYAIVTDDFRTIKLITKSDNDDCYRLVPINKAVEYHEQDIPKHLIRDVFQVLGAIKKF